MHPLDASQWRLKRSVIMESTSAVVAQRLLPEPPTPFVWEFWSVRGTMTHTGTGNLASQWLTNQDEPAAGIGNAEVTVMRQSEQVDGTEILHHWGRDNQRNISEPTFYFPPEFYWGREIWHWVQNGAGAEVGYMIVILHRLVRFSRGDYPSVLASVGGYKDTSLESA